MSKNCILFIVGMHRSGTSAVTGVCQLLGLHPGRTLMAPNTDNPRGFWENQLIVDAHDRLLCELNRDWDSTFPLPANCLTSNAASTCIEELEEILIEDFNPHSNWVIKDPRLCLLFPIWEKVVQRVGRESRVLLVCRHPEEVAASLIRRDSHSKARAFRLINQYTVGAIKNTERCQRQAIKYETALRQGAEFAATLWNGFPGLFPSPLRNKDQVDGFLTSKLRHEIALEDETDCGRAYRELESKPSGFIEPEALNSYLQFLEEGGHQYAQSLQALPTELELELEGVQGRAILYKKNYLRVTKELVGVHEGYSVLTNQLENDLSLAAEENAKLLDELKNPFKHFFLRSWKWLQRKFWLRK